MTRFRLLFAFTFFPAATALAVATVPAGAGAAAAPVAAPRRTVRLLMKFSEAPLGNVIRVFSARFGVPFTIEARAKAPITGDFTAMELRPALAEAARQAGLYVIPMGKGPADGFRLSLHAPPAPAGATKPAGAASEAPAVAKNAVAAKAAPAAPPSASERRRAELLEERARLLREAAKLGS